jgi:class 3 adenylate cyclase
MLDTANRTFICSVVFIDLVGYSKKPVTEQIRLKTSLTNNLSEAIKDIPVNDRIILDTGDGAAISFLGDPEDALFVTLSLREAMLREGAESEAAAGDSENVRMGINLGPVKLVKDINGHPNIIGDGINVAQRIMSFARPGQIVVSRSYYDVVSNLASEYAKLFTYEGSRTDKHVREHEIYVVGHHEGALQKARDGMKDRASATTPHMRKMSGTGTGGVGAQTVTLTIPSFVQDKKKLTFVAGGLAAIVLVLAVLVATKKPSGPAVAGESVAATPPASATPASTAGLPPPGTIGLPAAGTTSAAPTDPTKVAIAPANGPAPGTAGEPKKDVPPETKVLSPAPTQVPAPAPAPDTKVDPKAADAVKAEGAKAAEAAKSDPAKVASAPPAVDPAKAVLQATIFLNISPWGEVFVNGRSQGVSPPKKFVKLDPGKYKIEVKNTTFPVHAQSLEVKAREEVTLKHRFQ